MQKFECVLCTMQVNISDTSTLGETCGLCGTTDGVLQFRNGNTANIMNRTEVDAFANSYLVAPRDQFLHPQRRECGKYSKEVPSLPSCISRISSLELVEGHH